MLRIWDPFCAPKSGEVGFLSGKVGLDFFIFLRAGVAQKGSRMRTGGGMGYDEESACAGGGVGADSGVWGWGGCTRGSGWSVESRNCRSGMSACGAGHEGEVLRPEKGSN